MSKAKVATVWLDGCSGCHMSFLDMDEGLLNLAGRMTLVYSPLVDAKDFPPDVDVTLVEGAVSTDEDESKIRRIRQRTRILVALGDCAVTGNVPSMRNPFDTSAVLDRAYVENAEVRPGVPTVQLPVLLRTVVPVHHVVDVDVFVPGCPPSADVIQHVLDELLDGNIPDVTALTRFGK